MLWSRALISQFALNSLECCKLERSVRQAAGVYPTGAQNVIPARPFILHMLCCVSFLCTVHHWRGLLLKEHRGSGLDFSFTEWKEECFQVRPVSKVRLMSGVLLNCSQTNSSLPLPASVTPYKGHCEETPKMGSIIVCKNFCMVKNNFFIHCLFCHFRIQISQYTTITTVFKRCHCWNVPQLFIYPLFSPPFGLLTVCGVFEGCRGVKMSVAGFQWWEEVRNSGACLWNRNLPAFTWHLPFE